jgi:hypothetical protein
MVGDAELLLYQAPPQHLGLATTRLRWCARPLVELRGNLIRILRTLRTLQRGVRHDEDAANRRRNVSMT